MKETKQKKKTTKQSNNALNKKLNKKPNNEEFVMQPKVDYCFKELMKDPYIRKGFLSAILSIPAEEIKETTSTLASTLGKIPKTSSIQTS